MTRSVRRSCEAFRAICQAATAAGGTSLVEVLVAAVVFAVGAAALVPLVVASVHTTRAARDTGLATWMAWQKVEELRALTYARDESGAPVTDTWSDTTREPVVHAGGTGLTPSTSSALDADTAGYVDYLDEQGRRSSVRGVFVRRWAITPSGGADDLVRLEVRVHHVGAPGLGVVVSTLRARHWP